MINAFKITEKPIVTFKDPSDVGYGIMDQSIGTFDKMYHFRDAWTYDEENVMAEWLSHNCTENFIFNKLSSGILAGGMSDNKHAWDTLGRDRRDLEICEYHIKLYSADITMFEMVWLTDFM